MNNSKDNHVEEIMTLAATWAFLVFAFSIGYLLATVTF
jgi:hypothetical protein